MLDIKNFINGELDFGYLLIYRHRKNVTMKDLPIKDIKKLGGVSQIQKISTKTSYTSPEFFLTTKLNEILSILMGFNLYENSYLKFFLVDREVKLSLLSIKYPDVNMKCVNLNYSVFEQLLNESQKYFDLMQSQSRFKSFRSKFSIELPALAKSTNDYTEADYMRMLEVVDDFYENSIAMSVNTINSFFI